MGFRENLKSELTYSGMLVKELSAKSGVNKYSLDNYLNKKGKIPSAEIAVRIARALGVSVEYLVMGEESSPQDDPPLSVEARTVGRLTDQLDIENKRFALDFVKWLTARQLPRT